MMEVTRKRRIILWSLWTAIVPAGLYLIYQSFPPPAMNLWDILAFSIVAILTALMPLTINGTPMFLVQWVTIAVFLKYGLFTEIILSQLTVLILLFRSRSGDPRTIRFPFNSFMFFILSVIAGLVYIGLGGQIGSLNTLHILLFGFIYQMVYFVANHFFLYFYDALRGADKTFFSIDTIWDFIITIVVFPYALALYMLEASIGLVALLLLGVPLLMVAILLRMYSSSEKINLDLKKAGNIGHQLAARLSSDEVLDQFTIQVTDIFQADYAYVIDYHKGELIMLRIYENNRFQNIDVEPVRDKKGIAGNVIINDTSFIYNKKSQWETITTGNFPSDSESLMATPIARNNKTEGVLIIASRKKYAFAEHHLQIMDILSTYFAVSLEKAGLVQRAIAKSERCGLTNLYNYRYLDEALEKCMVKVNSGELANLSLVMMDIDHFKSINDKYGHQSGNDILIQLARMIEQEVGDEGTVARYGGEEFIILFPDFGKDLSMLFAESLRKKIEKHNFIIQSDLDSDRSERIVNVTMSIGVSTAPDDSDDGMALIRNADRALYIGAKQAGRNKVAAYVR